jgi:putative phosphoribosyl transferase
MRFYDRSDAGRQLAALIQGLLEPGSVTRESVLVLALPRGGVPVGFEIAHVLGVPLDVFVVRKLGTPGHEELAMGAIASGTARVINQKVVQALGISTAQIEETVARETQELHRREELYRGNRPPLDVRGKTILLVDDGLATGYTMRAAIAALRQEGPKHIIVAVPVAARSTCAELEKEADAAVCLYAPFDFMSVGQWYRNFSQTSDDEVRRLLDQANNRSAQDAA